MAGRGDTLKWFQDAKAAPTAASTNNLEGGGSFWSSPGGASAPVVAEAPAPTATAWAGMAGMFTSTPNEASTADPPASNGGLWGGGDDEWACGLSRWQRMQAGALLMTAAVVLLGTALLVFLPLALVMPGKFAMTFTLGSAAFMAAFAIVRGPRATAAHLFAPGRAAFTAAYLGSMALTLYSTFISKSYLLILFATAVQSGALAWYGATYVPGGAAGMAALSGLCWRVTTSTARGVAAQVVPPASA